MRRLLTLAFLSLTMTFTADVWAQPPLPPPPPGVPLPGPDRAVRDLDRSVRRAAPVRRHVRRRAVRRPAAGRRRAVGHHRRTLVTLRPPFRGLPVLRLPSPW